MKKIKKFLLGNIKTVIAFVIGTLISGVTVYAATVIAASQVGYTPPSGSGISSTNVQGAIDELYTRANTWINPSYIDFTTLATNTKKTILASSAGICIKRNNKVSCMKRNNWSVEKDHIQQIFSDISCIVDLYFVNCNASDFRCRVYDYGNVDCRDKSDNSNCNVNDDGSVNCN